MGAILTSYSFGRRDRKPESHEKSWHPSPRMLGTKDHYQIFPTLSQIIPITHVSTNASKKKRGAYSGLNLANLAFIFRLVFPADIYLVLFRRLNTCFLGLSWYVLSAVVSLITLCRWYYDANNINDTAFQQYWSLTGITLSGRLYVSWFVIDTYTQAVQLQNCI